MATSLKDAHTVQRTAPSNGECIYDAECTARGDVFELVGSTTDDDDDGDLGKGANGSDATQERRRGRSGSSRSSSKPTLNTLNGHDPRSTHRDLCEQNKKRSLIFSVDIAAGGAHK